MKKILLVFALVFTWLSASAQKSELYKLFDRYKDTEGVTSIKISKPMFSMLNKLNLHDSDFDGIKPMLGKIQGLRMLVIENPDSLQTDTKTENQFKNINSDIAASLSKMKYEELMTVNSKGDNIKFLAGDAVNGFFDDLLLSIDSGKDAVLMLLDGKISTEDVNRMISETQSGNTDKRNTVSQEPGTRERSVPPFHGISVSSGIKVSFTQAKDQLVQVEADEDKLMYVKTEVENGILRIYINSPKGKSLRFEKLFLKVAGPTLDKISVSSGANLSTLNTVKSQSFDVDVSSGANLSAELDAKNNVDVDVSSGSSVRLKINSKSLDFSGSSGSSSTIAGTADETHFRASSAATVNSQDLVSKIASADASSGASVRLNVSERLTAEATSGASIRYKGEPKEVRGEARTISGGSVKPF